MTNRIAEVIEVLEHVRAGYLPSPTDSVRKLRIEAVRSVALQRGIDARSVLDKCTRQLQPEIADASAFDKLVKDWLMAGSDVLRNIVLAHAADSDDVRAVRTFFAAVSTSDVEIAAEFGLDPAERAFVEGRSVLKLHLSKERNAELVRRAKELWTYQQNGNVRCAACGFSFNDFYGERGAGYVEAHHRLPISTLTAETLMTVEELAPVCSNCHRIIHRRTPWISVETLRDIVLENASQLKQSS